MPRAIWSGTISFGLVNVPVKAFTGARDHAVHFNQLDKRSGARIKNQTVSEKSGRPVDRDDIELGFEVSSGRYVTFDREEIEELRPESTRSVEVSDFVDLDEIDPIYYKSTYWLGPDGDAASKAYQLLLTAMEDRQRVGIGTVVMRNKQYLAAVRPLDGALAMSTMRFADEVVPKSEIDAIPQRRAKPDPKTLRLAEQILDSLTTEWDPKRYHDTYTEELRSIIKRKDKGKDVVHREEPRAEAKVLDLMAALEASVDAAKSGRRAAATSKRTAGTRTSTSKRAASKRPEPKRPVKKSGAKASTPRKKTATRKSA
jgi:DNA end-binding protein Ku